MAKKEAEKRPAPERGFGINAIIAACNKHDRFRLLEDDTVLPGDLENPIHPAFSFFDSDGPMKQMLQLASQFIIHDSLLVFFVPLLYGRELVGTVNRASKTYLSDPIANVSEERKRMYIAEVREALHCLGHCIHFQYIPPIKRVYARTVRSDKRPAHIVTCCPAFQRRYSCRIELADSLGSYYTERYATASRCAQFRHDFLFATTLVHELVHAVGVLKRGDLNEPYIRTDYPETEWGYGWENFMFGCIINPQNRKTIGTHLLMRKVWADQDLANNAGGKEYSDLPMSYIAQWFRQETWSNIADQGPTAVPPPIAHFKIQSSNKFGAWIVSSDHPKIQPDLLALCKRWRQKTDSPTSSSQEDTPPPTTGKEKSHRIFWRARTAEQLQKSNVVAPVRIPKRILQCSACGQQLPDSRRKIVTSTLHSEGAVREAELVNVHRCASPCTSPVPNMSRKRHADGDHENSRVSKMVKR